MPEQPAHVPNRRYLAPDDPAVLAKPCPTCDAAAGQPCRRDNGKPLRTPHSRRLLTR